LSGKAELYFMEDNFKDTYQGFDPNKPESLIGLTILQEENLNNSIILANEIQNNFTNNLKAIQRIKQQLWVLDAAYMPSVLIELGFYQIKKKNILTLARTRTNGIANSKFNYTI
jgi:N-acetylmuramoyl-L-alanine amidase